jgi:hypothetical protein
MSEHLHQRLAALHQNLMRGKLPRSIRWAEAVELVVHLGQVQPQGGEQFAFTAGTERELFRRPHSGDLEIHEVSRLRRLLRKVGRVSADSRVVQGPTIVVVIDHHAARVFQAADLGQALSEVPIDLYDPYHFHDHFIHRKGARHHGDQVPENTSFHQEIVRALTPAKEIILIGHGVGKSSAVDALIDYLKKHHSDILEQIKATTIADLSALSETQIVTLARKVADCEHGSR